MKTNSKSLLLTVIALLTLFGVVSCSSTKTPKYVLSTASSLQYFDNYIAENPQSSTPPSINREGAKLSLTEKQKCEEVFNTVDAYYNIKVGHPQVKKTSFSKYYCLKTDSNMATSSILVTSLYDMEDETIFLFNDLEDWNLSMLAHEYCHYISHKLSDNNNDNYGFFYTINNNYTIKSINEGVCNWLSTNVYPHPQKTSIYEYETHCAALFSKVIGETELADAFFHGRIDILKNSFNKALENVYPSEHYGELELKPFDQFAIMLNEYSNFLSNVNEEPSTFIPAVGETANFLEEMCFFYGNSYGEDATNAMKQEAESLIKNSFMLPWKEISKISEIAKSF